LFFLLFLGKRLADELSQLVLKNYLGIVLSHVL
jgi:hypothetical protein